MLKEQVIPDQINDLIYAALDSNYFPWQTTNYVVGI